MQDCRNLPRCGSGSGSQTVEGSLCPQSPGLFKGLGRSSAVHLDHGGKLITAIQLPSSQQSWDWSWKTHCRHLEKVSCPDCWTGQTSKHASPGKHQYAQLSFSRFSAPFLAIQQKLMASSREPSPEFCGPYSQMDHRLATFREHARGSMGFASGAFGAPKGQ